VTTVVRALLRAALISLALTGAALAVEPDEILDDPVLEARARALSAELRCVVCQNESIDSSNAGVARDLRILVRERLVAGDTDAEVLDHVVARYGDFVLFRPPWKPVTYALWLGPALVGLIGLLSVTLVLARRGAASPVEELSPEEQAAFEAVGRDVGEGR
jgi:cytochrome c-type biogenesis protein CcmH